MDIHESNQFGPLSPVRLASFEVELGCRLPEDYRAFLLSHNGGRFDRPIFRISDDEGKSVLHHVLGLHDGPDYARLDWTRAAYRGRMPPQLLPVADDAVGNAVCIGITGRERGRIYFWDHERESLIEAETYWGNVTEVADSWAAFVQSLAASAA